jgi:U11/U12 small nuclear ribonucleoprotein SNRNP25
MFFNQGDPLLGDLHTEVTLEEVKSQIALEHGKAITVNVRRADNIVYREFISY